MKHTILIVDDELMTRKGILETLRKWAGGQDDILTAEHGMRALELLQAHKVDLLLTDIRMPGMDGLELLEEVRKQGNEVTAIMLTGYADFTYAQTGIRLGIVDYLLKPVDQAKLIEAVESGLQLASRKHRARISEKLYHPQLEILDKKQEHGTLNESVQKAISYMIDHLSESPGMKEVAAQVHLNHSYFSVLFKEETGYTFSEYYTSLKLKKAKEYLLTTNLDIFDISDKVGYQSSGYFIKIFKQAEGMTPKQYRDYLKK
ncbi:response regulator transcription factor [Marinicrinis sediminis]|uniref:Response regulator n=1 Tax=Marinicrinis sediminis TaxID=1652465 RepID=A0ABW5RCI3_9BACL